MTSPFVLQLTPGFLLVKFLDKNPSWDFTANMSTLTICMRQTRTTWVYQLQLQQVFEPDLWPSRHIQWHYGHLHEFVRKIEVFGKNHYSLRSQVTPAGELQQSSPFWNAGTASPLCLMQILTLLSVWWDILCSRWMNSSTTACSCLFAYFSNVSNIWQVTESFTSFHWRSKLAQSLSQGA